MASAQVRAQQRSPQSNPLQLSLESLSIEARAALLRSAKRPLNAKRNQRGTNCNRCCGRPLEGPEGGALIARFGLADARLVQALFELVAPALVDLSAGACGLEALPHGGCPG